ncbi:MAG TPA: HEAT repeat domain-containing protein [Acidimicrobiales bacterium]|nr:HEAT repeat domain-containing protein [Acidimicrobiales bacterium]
MPDSAIGRAQRRRAVAVAGHTGDVAVAREALGDADATVRATALGALGRLGGLTATELATALGDSSPHVRRRAALVAATNAGGDLRALLADDDHLVAEAAAWALGERNDEGAVPLLIDMTTSHNEPLCREAAVAALGAIGDPTALPAILAACSDKPAIRRRAVLALAPFDGADVEAAIDKALTDRDWQVRQAAEDLRRP